MNQIWFYTICSVAMVSLIAFVGILTFFAKKDIINKIVLILVSFAAGSLLGDAFIHLIPEAYNNNSKIYFSIYIIIGIVSFFMLEKIIHWRHCHQETNKNHPHPVGTMNLIGDAFHNFIDGMMISASFLISIPLGITTSIAVLLHEVPQEIGDYGILIYAGYTRFKALIYNFFSALFAVFGAILVLIVGEKTNLLTIFLIPFTAGGFIYIALSDLIPELHKEIKPVKSFTQLFFLVLGVLLMIILLRLE